MADDDSFDLSGDFSDSIMEDSSAALDLEADLGDSVSGIDAAEAEVSDDLVDDAAEEVAADEAIVAPKRKRKGFLSGLTIFDGMLLCSLVLVTMAALWMAYGLNEYGGFFSLPWKTTGITVK